MTKTILSSGIAAVVIAASPAGATTGDTARTDVQAVLDASAAGWNAADLGHFMTCYKNAPDTVYLSGGMVIRGYKAIRDRYAARFGNGSAAAMGRLTLDIIDFRLIGRDHAFVVGQFHLRRDAAAGGDVSGLTSLLFERTSAGWRIIADHS